MKSTLNNNIKTNIFVYNIDVNNTGLCTLTADYIVHNNRKLGTFASLVKSLLRKDKFEI